MVITRVTDKHVGLLVSCVIRGNIISEALIHKEGYKYYLLQNVKEGLNCLDKKGYKFSYTIGSGKPCELDVNLVSNIILLNSEKYYELWM